MTQAVGRGLQFAALVMRAAASILLVLLVPVACAATGDPSPGELPVFEACAPRACETAPVATEAAHLDAVIGSGGWTPFGDYTAGCLDASKNIPVAGTITLRGATHDAKFRLRGAPAGVECVSPYLYFDFTVCEDIVVRDTTIRLRTIAQDIHPTSPNWLRIVEVLEPCEAACGESELACEATHTCWSTVRDHCAYCLGGSNEACGCWDGKGFLPDGAACQIAISGDVSVGGICKAGLCITDG